MTASDTDILRRLSTTSVRLAAVAAVAATAAEEVSAAPMALEAVASIRLALTIILPRVPTIVFLVSITLAML